MSGGKKVRGWLACGAVVLMLGGAVWGAKQCVVLPATFPGVDADGNLDFGNTTAGQAKLCVSTNGKFRLKGSAVVDNESGASQKYDNADFPPSDPGIAIKRLKYRVKANGAAKVSVSGTGLMLP